MQSLSQPKALPVLRVAAAQIAERAETESDDDVLCAVRAHAEAASDRGVGLLIFPEMSLTGYSISPKLTASRAQPREGPLLQAVAAISREVGVALCVGYAERPAGSDLIFNALAVVDEEGQLVHHYRKTHLYGEGELALYTPGGAEQLATFTLGGLQIGTLICMDCEYPEPARLLALQGAELLLIPTALAAGPLERLTPTCVIPTRALENHVHICYCNYNGAATGEHPAFCGRSTVVGPDGIDLARAAGPEAHHRGREELNQIVDAVVERTAFVADIERNPYLMARRPKLYGPLSAL